MEISLGNDQWQDHVITVLTFGFPKKKDSVSMTYYWDAFVKRMLHKKSNKYYTTWVRIYSPSFRECNAHEPFFFYMWPAPLYTIFLLYLINGMIFREKRLLNIKCVSNLSTFVWNIFHTRKKWARCDHKCVFVWM